MPATPGKIAFIVEDFEVGSPAQQLLDRWLIGYPRDGELHRPDHDRITLCLESDEANAEIRRRSEEFGLVREPNVSRAVAGAEAVVVVWNGLGTEANEARFREILQAAPHGAACFIHGALANTAESAGDLAGRAAERRIILCAGTSIAVTYRLPEIDLTPGTRLREALIVVQGPFPHAELDALEGLLPLIERRRNGESGVAGARFLEGDEVWRAGTEGRWSWPLLASAISRSNTVQGDPLKDGRTQDIVGAGLIRSLAKNPRGWLLEHRDGLRSTLLALDGAVADYNFAVRAADGAITSAQLYRPPKPAQEQFSRLAGAIEDFFRTGKPPWSLDRSLLIVQLLEEFRRQNRQR
jgi:hypothetical protein